MAHATNTTYQASGAGQKVRGFFSVIGDYFVLFIEAQARTQQIETLNAMSDQELLRRGIKSRQDIVRYVFRDRLYV